MCEGGEKLGYSLNKNGRPVNTSILWNQIYQQDNPCDFRSSLPHYHYRWEFRQRTAFNCTFREINIINEWGGGICVLGTSLVSLSKLLRLLTNIVIFRSVVWWGPSLQSETRTKTSEVGKFSQTHPVPNWFYDLMISVSFSSIDLLLTLTVSHTITFTELTLNKRPAFIYYGLLSVFQTLTSAVCRHTPAGMTVCVWTSQEAMTVCAHLVQAAVVTAHRKKEWDAMEKIGNPALIAVLYAPARYRTWSRAYTFIAISNTVVNSGIFFLTSTRTWKWSIILSLTSHEWVFIMTRCIMGGS